MSVDVMVMEYVQEASVCENVQEETDMLPSLWDLW